MNDLFSRLAHRCAYLMGRPISFVAAVLLTAIWLATGPLLNWSDTFQLLANTATTIFTWWAVFLLQNTQNRDTAELNLKLDELIRADERAHNRMIGLEKLTERQLMVLQKSFNTLSDADRNGAEHG